MDSSIQSLKNQISLAKEEIKQLSASTSASITDKAHNTLSSALPTAEISSRIATLDNEVHFPTQVIVDPWTGRTSQAAEIWDVGSSDGWREGADRNGFKECSSGVSYSSEDCTLIVDVNIVW